MKLNSGDKLKIDDYVIRPDEIERIFITPIGRDNIKWCQINNVEFADFII